MPGWTIMRNRGLLLCINYSKNSSGLFFRWRKKTCIIIIKKGK